METLNVVVSEIILCLILAWILGFLAAWILFRKVQKEYEEEIEEIEESLSYVSASNKIQEKELIAQSLKLKEFEKLSKNEIQSKIEEDSSEIIDIKDENHENSNDEDILKRIENNLDTSMNR